MTRGSLTVVQSMGPIPSNDAVPDCPTITLRYCLRSISLVEACAPTVYLLDLLGCVDISVARTDVRIMTRFACRVKRVPQMRDKMRLRCGLECVDGDALYLECCLHQQHV
jgi:hypothetical protein